MLRATLTVLICALALLSSARAQDEVIQLVVELLGNEDKDIRALAFEQIRTEVPGEAATLAFADLLLKQSPETQVGLLSALADRGDKAATPAVRKLLSDNDNIRARVAALKALGKLGEASDLETLIGFMASGSADEQAAARRSLVVMQGDEVLASMAGQLSTAKVPVQIMLMEILTERRARDAVPAILAVAIAENADLRRAAMTALGQLGQAEHIPGMVQGVLKAERGRERDAAEKAVMLACHRIEDSEDQAKPLLDVMEELPESDRTILLSTLGRVGGPAARDVLEDLVADSDSKKHELGLRALCNWPDASIAFRLLELARIDEDPKHRRMALRALIRVAPLPDDRSDQLRLDLLRTAWVMCREEADRLQVLDRASAVRTIQTLRFVEPFMEQPPYAEQACLTVVELAHHSELRDANKEEFHAALGQVIQLSKDPTVKDRAGRYKRGETWVRPK